MLGSLLVLHRAEWLSAVPARPLFLASPGIHPPLDRNQSAVVFGQHLDQVFVIDHRLRGRGGIFRPLSPIGWSLNQDRSRPALQALGFELHPGIGSQIAENFLHLIGLCDFDSHNPKERQPVSIDAEVAPGEGSFDLFQGQWIFRPEREPYDPGLLLTNDLYGVGVPSEAEVCFQFVLRNNFQNSFLIQLLVRQDLKLYP